jgi:hypothetical protein
MTAWSGHREAWKLALPFLPCAIRKRRPIFLDGPEAAYPLNYAPDKAVSVPMQYAMTNSFGFGGANTSLIFSRLV